RPLGRRLPLHGRRRNVFILGRLLAFLQRVSSLHGSHHAALRVGNHQLARLLYFLRQEITQLCAIVRVLAIESSVSQVFHLRPWPEAQRWSRRKQMQRVLRNLGGELLEWGQIVEYPNSASVCAHNEIVVPPLIFKVVNRSVRQPEPEQVPLSAIVP